MKHTNRLLFALLAAAALLFAAGCSDSSDDDSISTSDLAGTTWTASYEDVTIGITFETSGQVTMIDEDGDASTGGSYSASGSTVILYYDNGEAFMRLVYSSGQLFRIIFTKVS